MEQDYIENVKQADGLRLQEAKERKHRLATARKEQCHFPKENMESAAVHALLP